MFEIRPYEPQRDALRVYTLWQHTLGQLWPLPYETFHSVTITQATPVDATAIFSFEEQHFPQWFPYYQQVLHHQGYADVVVAKEVNHKNMS